MDPSLTNTALVWGFIRDGELEPVDWTLSVTKPNKNMKVAEDTVDRCRHTQGVIQEVLDDWQPDICFAETPSGSKSSNAMKSYGVSCAYIAQLVPKSVEVTPTELKQATVGKKTASKDEMMEWAYDSFPDFPWEFYQGKLKKAKMEHVADAIGAAYTGMKKTWEST